MVDKKNGVVYIDAGDTIASVSKACGITAEEFVSLNSKYISTVYDSLDPFVGKPFTYKLDVKTTSNTVEITGFGLQYGTTRTLYLTWAWDHENNKIDHYQVIWSYKTTDLTYNGNVIWYEASNTNVDDALKQNSFNAPENAIAVKVKVRPVTGKDNKDGNGENTEGSYGWTKELEHYFKFDPPAKPSSAPSVTINKYKLTAELNGYYPVCDNCGMREYEAHQCTDPSGVHAFTTQIEFQVVKDDKTIVNTGKASIYTGRATYACNIGAGSLYKVRCRAVRSTLKSDWTDFCSNEKSLPTAPSFNSITVLSKDSVKFEWTKVNSADSYVIQYTTKQEYFDSEGGEVSSITVANDLESTDTVVSRTVYNLATGGTYYVRICAVVDGGGESKWSSVESFILGTKPESPTTWSSTNSVIIGEALNLYWIHNSKDGSSQTYAELELTINGEKQDPIKIRNTTDEELKDKTSVYNYPTDNLDDGAKVEWRVRTAGVLIDDNDDPAYGEWSIMRTVNIYAPPVLTLALTDNLGQDLETLTSFPFNAVCSVMNTANQEPIGYYLTITSNSNYTTIDNTGHDKVISEDTVVYSKYFDKNVSNLIIPLSANDVDLENNANYTVTCTVSMNSGLKAESSATFSVGWDTTTYSPFADIAIDKENLSAYIRPYSNGGDDVLLSVYRREFDGSFMELGSELENSKNIFITDPHPALDYARYRIVAKEKATGAISYSDVHLPVGEKAIIIQWDAQWHDFEATENKLENSPTIGSILRLPYNIDVSDSYTPEVSLVNYIGRSHPVSYYGTHIGQTSSWSTAIPKDDKETLYALRKLAIWMGDVYVREPSGSGYWANITVSFSQTHCEVTIPVTLNIKRVEGGV